MIYSFEDFELDTRLYELRRNGETCRMEPQVFDVLLYLVENRNRVVTKNDLFENIWKDRFVSDSALSSRVKAVRIVLGDGGREQRLIKTVHGRGFRFIGDVSQRPDAADQRNNKTAPTIDTGENYLTELEIEAPVGRQQQLATIGASLNAAHAGQRQIVFVTGEAGLGKTTLVRSFVDSLTDDNSIHVAHGQCLEYHGQGEAYMPILEALSRLCAEDESNQIINLLSKHAPTWIAKMPGFVDAGNHDETLRHLRGGTQDRMLREIVEALEVLASDQTLVLILEDIHWSDPSTIDLITRLAARTDEAHLMVVGTFRPVDLKGRQQSMYSALQTLVVRGRGREIALDTLNEESVGEYLDRRFAQENLFTELTAVLHRRTNGNPLFMQNLVEHWIIDGLLVEDGGVWRLTVTMDQLTRGVPRNLRQFIEQFIDVLDPLDRLVLEAAAVRGSDFSCAELAAAIDKSEHDVEERCVALAQSGRWIQARGVVEWPNGTISSGFSFNHDLYLEVMYELIPVGQRTRMHRSIGEHLEKIYGHESPEKAVELANHFVEGRVFARAVHYLHLAAKQALYRVAPREAVESLRKGIILLQRLPNKSDLLQQELVLQIMLAPALISIEGVGSPEAEASFIRARSLCDKLEDQANLQQVLYGIGAMYEVRGDFSKSQALMKERQQLPLFQKDDLLRVETNELLACSLFHQGKFNLSLKKAQDGIHRFNQKRHSMMAPAFGENPGTSCYFWASLDLWIQGQPKEALDQLRLGLEISEHPDQHYSLSTAYIQAAVLYQLMGDIDSSLEWSEKGEAIAVQQGNVLRIAMSLILNGWAMAMKGEIEEGIKKLKKGIDYAETIGAGMDRPYFLGLLAEAYGAASQPREGLDVIDEALAAIEDQTRFFYTPDLQRQRGILLLALQPEGFQDQAVESFEKALAVARKQKAVSMELRAATALAGLWHTRGRQTEATDLLEQTVSTFGEGLDTQDLRDARELIQTMCHSQGTDSPRRA